jgi:hypothetical protein
VTFNLGEKNLFPETKKNLTSWGNERRNNMIKQRKRVRAREREKRQRQRLF